MNGALGVLQRYAYKLVLMPIVAGIAYEIIRFAGGRKESLITKLLLLPGLLMQKITTREPDRDMIEVAIKSLLCVRESEESSCKKAAEEASV